jgi:hypothetical protein
LRLRCSFDLIGQRRREVGYRQPPVDAPTPDNHVETRFEQDAIGTLMTMRMTLPDAETRAAMLATGMERGMDASYARLEAMI